MIARRLYIVRYSGYDFEFRDHCSVVHGLSIEALISMPIPGPFGSLIVPSLETGKSVSSMSGLSVASYSISGYGSAAPDLRGGRSAAICSEAWRLMVELNTCGITGSSWAAAMLAMARKPENPPQT